MTVHFTLSDPAFLGYFLQCSCGKNQKVSKFGYILEHELALVFKEESKVNNECPELTCDDWCITPKFDGPSISELVQVENKNAVLLLDALGFTGDFADNCTGRLAPKDLLGRIIVAKALTSSSTQLLSTMTYLPDGSTTVTPGRKKGWLQECLDELEKLANLGITHKRTIVWS
jgi:hypothetical protein